jgi:galactonate dehydratase
VYELSAYLIGRDPEDIEDIWQTLYRGGFYRGGPVLMSAIAGIDQALWDLKGKAHGLPVWQMLGGAVRRDIQVYSWIGGDRPSEVAEAARERQGAGYRAVKMNATEDLHYLDSYAKVDAVLSRVQAVREAVGQDFGVALDFHGRVHRAMAKVLLSELAPYRLLFVEEPVLPEHHEALVELAARSSVPIALGERSYSRWDFKEILRRGGVDVLQPDLSHAGGISEVRKIAAMAEAYDVALAPHCPLGPVALAACLQLDACTPNAFIQEQSMEIHYNEGLKPTDYLADPAPLRFVQGRAALPTAPGLGVTVNEEVVRAASEGAPDWKNPLWRNRDGTVAEW